MTSAREGRRALAAGRALPRLPRSAAASTARGWNNKSGLSVVMGED